MTHVAHGIIHGKTIELTEDLGLQPGQAVIVQLDPAPSEPRTWGDGIRASAGALADMPELDALMDQIQADRKSERTNQFPESPR